MRFATRAMPLTSSAPHPTESRAALRASTTACTRRVRYPPTVGTREAKCMRSMIHFRGSDKGTYRPRSFAMTTPAQLHGSIVTIGRGSPVFQDLDLRPVLALPARRDV